MSSTRRIERAVAVVAVVFAVAFTNDVHAQTSFDDAVANCFRARFTHNVGHCEAREVPVGTHKGTFTYDDDHIGGIIFTTDRAGTPSARVLIQTSAPTRAEALKIAEGIQVSIEDGVIRTVGPKDADRNHWWVLYEVTLPEGSSVNARTMNGQITLEHFTGRADIYAVNGPVLLRHAAGDISGGTENGPIHVALSGKRWEGKGLDLQSSNGPVDLVIPDDYSAHVITGTINGPLDMYRRMTLRRISSKRIVADLGGGGATVRVTTENGPASIR